MNRIRGFGLSRAASAAAFAAWLIVACAAPEQEAQPDTGEASVDTAVTDAAPDVSEDTGTPRPEGLLATLDVDVTEGNAPLAVTFTGSVSGIEATEAAFVWDFGNGSFSDKQAPGPFVYHTPGNYLVRLTVTLAGTSHTATDEVVIKVRGAADLKLTKPLVQSATELPPGGELVLSYKLTNEGDEIREGFDLVTVLSKDEKLDLEEDLTLETERFPGMPASGADGSSVSRLSHAITLPTDVSQGTWFLLVKADANEEIKESNELNNTALSTSFVEIKKGAGDRPELSVTSIEYGQGPFNAGQFLNYTLSIANTGKVEATSFKFRVYVSSNETLDANDLQITDDSNTSIYTIKPGKSVQVQRGWPVPDTLSDGAWWLIAEVDPLGTVFEDDEDNNLITGEIPFQIEYIAPTGFDLDITAAEVTPHATYWNGSVKVDLIVANSGTAPTPGYRVAIYASQSLALNPNYATLVSEVPLVQQAPIPPGGSGIISAVVKLPGTIPTGTYYIGAIVDPDSELPELEEGNNWAVIPDPVELYPQASVDLAASGASFQPQVVGAGEDLKVSYTLTNTGSTGSGAFTNWIVLSKSPGLSSKGLTPGKDVVIAEVNISNVDPGTDVARTEKIKVPLALDHTQSTWYVGVFADGPGAVTIDAVKTNNITVAAQPITVLGPLGGCFEDAHEPNDNAAQAKPLAEGQHGVLGSCGNDDWYRVEVPQGHSLFVTVSSESPLQLAPLPWELDVTLYDPASLPIDVSEKKGAHDDVRAYAVPATGEYVLRVQPAAYGNEAHYLVSVDVVPPVDGIDLVVDDVVALPDTIYPGGLMDVSYDLVNLGNQPSGPFQVEARLVTSPEQPPGEGLLLATATAASIAGATTETGKLQVVVPQVESGSFAIAVVADTEGAVAEADEVNNVAVSGAVAIDGSLSCEDDGFEPNDHPSIATSLAAEPNFFAGLTVCPQLDDWYAFEVPAAKLFAVTVKYSYSMAKGELGVQLLDAAGGVVAEQIGGKGNASVVIPYIFNAGLYRLRVFNTKAGGDPYTYSLGVSVGSPSPADTCEPDAYEPNSTVDTAALIGCGLQKLTFCKTDRDLFRIPGQAGEPLVLTLDHPKAELMAQLYEDPSDKPVAQVSGNGPLSYTPVKTGDLVLVVAPKVKDATPTPFGYALFVDGVLGIDLEITALSASPTTLYQGEDTVVDMVVENRCVSPSPELEWSVYVSTDPVWDPLDLEVLGGVEPSGLGGKDAVSIVEKAMVPFGTPPGPAWLIAVADPQDTVSESIETNNASSLPLDVLEVCIDDPLEPNDAWSQAPKLALAQPYAQLALCPADLDWYKVDLQAGKTATVELSFVDAVGDLDLRLYGPQDLTKPLATSNTPGADGETIELLVKTTGTHYVRVNGFGGASNVYTLQITQK